MEANICLRSGSAGDGYLSTLSFLRKGALSRGDFFFFASSPLLLSYPANPLRNSAAAVGRRTKYHKYFPLVKRQEVRKRVTTRGFASFAQLYCDLAIVLCAEA